MAPFGLNGGNRSTKKKAENEEWSTLAAVGVAAVVLWGLAKIFGGSDGKKMKAPGKDYFIPRKDFEENPADWFRNHRK